MGGSGMNGFNTTKFPWPNKVYTRPLGIESLRPFSEPSLFGRTNRLASWNGKPGMHILGWNECMPNQCAKKVVSNSSGLVDFAIGLEIFVHNLPNRPVLFFWEIKITEGL